MPADVVGGAGVVLLPVGDGAGVELVADELVDDDVGLGAGLEVAVDDAEGAGLEDSVGEGLVVAGAVAVSDAASA